MHNLPYDASVIRENSEWIIYYSESQKHFYFYPTEYSSRPLPIGKEDLDNFSNIIGNDSLKLDEKLSSPEEKNMQNLLVEVNSTFGISEKELITPEISEMVCQQEDNVTKTEEELSKNSIVDNQKSTEVKLSSVTSEASNQNNSTIKRIIGWAIVIFFGAWIIISVNNYNQKEALIEKNKEAVEAKERRIEEKSVDSFVKKYSAIKIEDLTMSDIPTYRIQQKLAGQNVYISGFLEDIIYKNDKLYVVIDDYNVFFYLEVTEDLVNKLEINDHIKVIFCFDKIESLEIFPNIDEVNIEDENISIAATYSCEKVIYGKCLEIK